MKWSEDLVKDIRTGTPFDDSDNGVPHPRGYGHTFDANGGVVFSKEVTECNRLALMQNFMTIRDKCNAILEIGIGRDREESFCYVFFNSKKPECKYVGLDIEDRSFLNNEAPNVHTFMDDSSNYDANLERFKSLGIEKFDFIFIDGWHSINQVLRDWEYSNLLSDHGIIGFHNTSCHPGPHNFINNLDTDKWEVVPNFCPDDWGIGFVRKK